MIHVLPANLTPFVFGYNFNQRIKSIMLSDNLVTLMFGHDFNHPNFHVVLPQEIT